MRTVAVVLAGGSGQRFGGDLPKQMQVLAGRTLLEHSVTAFEQAPGVDAIIVVVPAGLVSMAGDLLAAGGFRKVSSVIGGGVMRTDSTRCAIAALCSSGNTTAAASAPDNSAPDNSAPGNSAPGNSAPDNSAPECNVLFHDAARPLVDQRIIADCISALGAHPVIAVAVPSSDTIVEVADGVVTAMPRRDALARFQTPQGFKLSVIMRAYELADADPDFSHRPATDDCGVVLRYLPEIPVRLVRGSERNIKITYPDDLPVAEALLRLPQPSPEASAGSGNPVSQDD